MAETERTVRESAQDIIKRMEELSREAAEVANDASEVLAQTSGHGDSFLITGLTVFVLACFVGYHVVWRVTPALHSPLMGLTNAISSVIIVGAVMATGAASGSDFATGLGFFAVLFASVNIFGGFIITQRMLHMFKKKG